jgi:hypothetical protein
MTGLWRSSVDAPIWVLRGLFAIVGLIAVAGAALFVMAYTIDLGSPVEIEVRNGSIHDAAVGLDAEPLRPVASLDRLKLVDDVEGSHRLEIESAAPGAVRVELLFEVGRWSYAEYLIEISDEPIILPPSP